MTIVALLVVTTAVALALVLHPFIRDVPSPLRSAFGIKMHEDQLRELQRDLDGGLIDHDQADAARVEIKRRILALSADRGRQQTRGADTPAILPIGLAFSVPVMCCVLYWALGSPGLPSVPLALRQLPANHPPVAAGQPVGSNVQPTAERRAEIQALPPKEYDRWISDMVDGLERRLLTSSPNDLDGRMMLGRSRTVLGDIEAAAAAYQKALALVANAEVTYEGGVHYGATTSRQRRVGVHGRWSQRSRPLRGLADMVAPGSISPFIAQDERQA